MAAHAKEIPISESYIFFTSMNIAENLEQIKIFNINSFYKTLK